MSAKDCGHHDATRRRRRRRLLSFILAFIFLTLFTILLTYLILRPTKPTFVLQDAALSAFNLSHPSLLTAAVHVTLLSRNPNSHIGIYYHSLAAHAAYRSQQITLPTSLPPAYLPPHGGAAVWSPFLAGAAVPIAPFIAASLSDDCNAGVVLINVKIDGGVRWKVGTWVSGEYRLWVNCPAYFTFGDRNNGVFTGTAINYQLSTSCHVDV